MVSKPPEKMRLANAVTTERKKVRELEKKISDLTNRLPDFEVTFGHDSLQLERPKLRDSEAVIAEVENVYESRYRHHNLLREKAELVGHLRNWLANQEAVANESARTILVHPKIRNAGTAPAKIVDLTIEFPKNRICALYYNHTLSGNRTFPLRRPQSNRPGITLPAPVETVPQYLSNQGGYAYDVRLSENSFGISFPVFAHQHEHPFNPLYLTFRSWGDVGRFAADVTIRTHEPPDYRKFQVVIPVPPVG